MDKYVNSEVSQHIMYLIQIGANVQVVNGKMVYVKVNLDQNIQVSYVYHINKNNKYFLERIKPYPLPIKEFNTTKEVIDTIKIDIDQYRNAINSRNINQFIQINRDLHQAIKTFEDLFLYYNIKPETIERINKSLNSIRNEINESKTQCNRVFFEKDPENI